jgi:hypothetical protein
MREYYFLIKDKPILLDKFIMATELFEAEEFPVFMKYAVDCYYEYREQLVLLFCNCTRKDNHAFVESLCHTFLSSIKKQSKLDEGVFVYLSLFYKMIAYVRDIHHGQGERELSYCMLSVLYRYYPTLAIYCLYRFTLGTTTALPFGSWRDAKYLCEYLRQHSKEREQHPFIDTCIEMINEQLAKDVATVHSLHKKKSVDYRNVLSLVVKWIPREHSRFDWLFDRLAVQWTQTFHPYILSATSKEKYEAGLRKAKMKYRHILSYINTLLDTTEIKLCSQQWDTIVPQRVPQSCYIKRQGQLFGSINKNTSLLQCAQKQVCAASFSSYFEERYAIGGVYDPDREHASYVPYLAPVFYFVNMAMQCIEQGTTFDCSRRIALCNQQWKQLSDIIGKGTSMPYVPILDMSFDASLQKKAYTTSIGMACLIAERSSIGRRIFVIGQTSCWIDLTECSDFVSMIRHIMDVTSTVRSTSSCITHAVSLLQSACGQDTSEVRLVFFQVHSGMVEQKMGLPFVVYWNMSQHDIVELPCNMDDKHGLVLSGLSPCLLQFLFGTQQYKNSYEFMVSILEQDRYQVLGDYLTTIRKG